MKLDGLFQGLKYGKMKVQILKPCYSLNCKNCSRRNRIANYWKKTGRSTAVFNGYAKG